MKGYKKCAADQFLGRCLIVNELSSRPLDQVDQVDKPQSQLPLPIKYKWVFWAALLLSQLSGSIDIFLAGPFAKLLILGNPETLFANLRLLVFSELRSLLSLDLGSTGRAATYSLGSIQVYSSI